MPTLQSLCTKEVARRVARERRVRMVFELPLPRRLIVDVMDAHIAMWIHFYDYARVTGVVAYCRRVIEQSCRPTTANMEIFDEDEPPLLVFNSLFLGLQRSPGEGTLCTRACLFCCEQRLRDRRNPVPFGDHEVNRCFPFDICLQCAADCLQRGGEEAIVTHINIFFMLFGRMYYFCQAYLSHVKQRVMLVVARFENNFRVLDARIVLVHQTALQHLANQR